MTPPAEGLAARLVLGPALRAQPDRRLVKLVREGYEAAFEEIVRRYGKPLTRYAGTIVDGRAEDVTQDAFSKALLALRRDGAEIELRPWLFRIVRNTALNELRDSPPTPASLAEAIATGGSPAEELERREELADLMRRLQSLPEAQRAAIVMRELEGLSHEEIAAALGLSGGAARQAIYRARRALRDGMGMLLPMPLLKVLLAGTAAAPVEAAAGVGGATSVGVGLKAAAATVLVASAVGAGVAVHDGQRGHPNAQAQPEQAVAEDSGGELSPGPSGKSGGGQSDASHSDREHGGEADAGDDRGGPSGDDGRGQHGSGPSSGSGGGDQAGGTRDGDRDGQGSEPSDDHGGGSGPSGGDGRHSGGSSGGSSGPGGDEHSGNGGEAEDHSGPSSGGGDEQPATESPESSSGPGSGGGGSGDGGGGSGDGGSGEINVGGSGDSHDGDGFSLQTEPQTKEEP